MPCREGFQAEFFWVAQCGVRGVQRVCARPRGGVKNLPALPLPPSLSAGWWCSIIRRTEPSALGLDTSFLAPGFASDAQGWLPTHTLYPCTGKGFIYHLKSPDTRTLFIPEWLAGALVSPEQPDGTRQRKPGI